MDRFIVKIFKKERKQKIILKSNMDRFIGVGQDVYFGRTWLLKSNMDRFIEQDYYHNSFK